MNTTAKGNKLEDRFYEHLIEQQNSNEPVHDLFIPECCKIYKKKGYFSRDRNGDVELDVTIELFRKGSTERHSIIVFECKNHDSPVQERDIRDFSDKIRDIFPHSAKGVIVTASRLQSGAANVARNRHLGIVKYDEHGFETEVERKGGSLAKNSFIKAQILVDERPARSLKFSAFNDGRFYDSIISFLNSVDPSFFGVKEPNPDNTKISIPYLSKEEIRNEAQTVRSLINYKEGAVDLIGLCSELAIGLDFTGKLVKHANGENVLGSAKFDQKIIEINYHENPQRQRFTLAHEIGHFCLGHSKFMRSESIIESDLMADSPNESSFDFDWLEYQANEFASELLLPTRIFEIALNVGKEQLDIKNRGHGEIYVDDQYCNLSDYYQLLQNLSNYFDVSQQAVEVKLRKIGALTDQRTKSYI